MSAVVEFRPDIKVPGYDDWDYSALPRFAMIDRTNIENMSSTLNVDEICSYYFIDYKNLTEYERLFISVFHQRGAAKAKVTAINKLFKAMSGNSKSVDACVSYLRATADNWKEAEANAPGTKKVEITVNSGE